MDNEYFVRAAFTESPKKGFEALFRLYYNALCSHTLKQIQNLLVSVCISSSHIAFGSIRIEPVFMILGQSAATAAILAIDNNQAVQDIDYNKLKEQLLKDKQRLGM